MYERFYHFNIKFTEELFRKEIWNDREWLFRLFVEIVWGGGHQQIISIFPEMKSAGVIGDYLNLSKAMLAF